jgi:hypothetical protein
VNGHNRVRPSLEVVWKQYVVTEILIR